MWFTFDHDHILTAERWIVRALVFATFNVRLMNVAVQRKEGEGAGVAVVGQEDTIAKSLGSSVQLFGMSRAVVSLSRVGLLSRRRLCRRPRAWPRWVGSLLVCCLHPVRGENCLDLLDEFGIHLVVQLELAPAACVVGSGCT